MPDSNGNVDIKGWVPPGGTRWRVAAAVLPETTASALAQLRKEISDDKRLKVVKSSEDRFTRLKAHELFALDRPARVRILFERIIRRLEFKPSDKRRANGATAALYFDGKSIATLTRPRKDELAKGGDGLESVLKHASLTTPEIDSILTQSDEVLSSFGSVLALHGALDEANVTLLEVVLEVTYTFVHLFKLHFDVPLPIQLSAKVVPIIPTPSNSSFPGGHAAMAHAAAAFFGSMHSERAPVYRSLADQIALSRVKAGVHFELDSEAGKHLGARIGEALHKAYKANEEFIQSSKPPKKAAAVKKKMSPSPNKKGTPAKKKAR